MRALGVHIFAGGFTVGVKEAGFDVAAHFEGDEYGVSTARLNWPEMPIFVGRPSWPMERYRDEIDFVYCNPPCAPWSANGKRSQGKDVSGMGAWRSDPRVACWRNCFDVLMAVRPHVFAVESVPGVYSDGREMIDAYTREALMLGYSVTHILEDAKWFGIPQSRKRFFFVAHRTPSLPLPGTNWAPPPGVGPTLAEVSDRGWTVPTSKTHIPLIERALPGDSLAATWERVTPPEMKVRGPNGKMTGKPFASNRRLPLDRPMGAFTGNTLYHPTEHRALGIEEAKAVCGYPEWFRLAGPESGWWALLARAVMPPVGRWLAGRAAAALELPDGAWADRRVTFVDLREPGREPVDLTKDYLDGSGRVRIRVRAGSEPAAAAIAATLGVRPEDVIETAWAPSEAPAQREGVTGAAPTDLQNGQAAVGLPGPPIDNGRPDAPRATDTAPERRGAIPPPVKIEPSSEDEKPLPGEGSGAFIKRLWMTGRYDPETLVGLVHANWSGRTTSVGDVRFNYYKLVDQHGAANVPPWPEKRSAKPAPRPTAPARETTEKLQTLPREPSPLAPPKRTPEAATIELPDFSDLIVTDGPDDGASGADPAIVSAVDRFFEEEKGG